MELGIAVNLPHDQLEKIRQIATLDLSRFKERLRIKHKASVKRLEYLEKELKRFFVLFVLDPSHSHVISGKVDELWHEFVMDTKAYREFCLKTIGRFIDHMPIRPTETKQWSLFCKNTKKIYHRYFGKPKTNLWAKTNMLCWGCGQDP